MKKLVLIQTPKFRHVIENEILCLIKFFEKMMMLAELPLKSYISMALIITFAATET